MKKAVNIVFNFRKDQTGQAMAETAITIMVFLMLILGIMQLALMFNARLVVEYAAYCAARSAIVHGADNVTARRAAQIVLTSLERKNIIWYNSVDVTVDIRSSMSGSSILFDDIKRRDENLIRVRVTYQYELIIPYVNRIISTLAGGTGNRIPVVATCMMRMQSDR